MFSCEFCEISKNIFYRTPLGDCLYEYITCPFFQKTYVPFSYTSYLYQGSIDFRINIAGIKYKWMQKFENVRNFIKCGLDHVYNMSLYEIYPLLPSNKTAQQNS